ncbi:hypothetical protein F1559_005051 [Cyanidiococcus yangmingshanensis]|uniref:ethanolamine kinase n=1 Tax=Cyanidiococcus yangmingshanensis TaxID=2690220 RepID=A0A7J7INU3_9RHOD|nr:hypothetical protein F1559_005051 [Cyanidiococcus yangmingshanensis]
MSQTSGNASAPNGQRDSTVVAPSSEATPAERREVLSVLQRVFPNGSWTLASCAVTRLQGGVTNRMFLCVCDTAGPAMLVRIFGSGDLFNRLRENSLFAELASAGLGAPLLAVFSRGRVEGILPGTPLDYRALHEKHIYSLVASALAELHCFKPSEHSLPRKEATVSQWQFCEKLLSKAQELRCVPSEELCNGIPVRLNAELRSLLTILPVDDIVFCHNDLLGANMLYDPETDKIRFVDFEYAGYAPRAYDLGNHFNEWMGLTENCGLSAADPLSRYPTPAEQRSFVETYVATWASLSSTNCRTGSQRKTVEGVQAETRLCTDRLVIEANAFSLLSHWIWSVWAFVMASDPPTDAFDYIHFARERLRIMREHWKERLEPLQHLFGAS